MGLGAKPDIIPAAADIQPRQRAARPKTIPEQMSDALGLAILRGEYRAGERLREQELAELYGVSRGPVRECIRILERHGMIELLPHRGVFVRGIDIGVVADLFNVRASLLGLSVRCFTRVAGVAELAAISTAVDRLGAAAENADTTPTSFALDNGRAGAAIYRRCGNSEVARILLEQAQTSLWGLLWRQYPLDFLTQRRRRDVAKLWERIAAAIRTKDETEAEDLTRSLLFLSRDHALNILGPLRGETLHSSKRIGRVVKSTRRYP